MSSSDKTGSSNNNHGKNGTETPIPGNTGRGLSKLIRFATINPSSSSSNHTSSSSNETNSSSSSDTTSNATTNNESGDGILPARTLSNIAKSIKFPNISSSNSSTSPSRLDLHNIFPNSLQDLLNCGSLTELIYKSKSSKESTTCDTAVAVPSFATPSLSLLTVDGLVDKASEIAGEYFAAVTAGAMLGAGITAGLFFGAIAASGLVSSVKSLSCYVSSLKWNYFKNDDGGWTQRNDSTARERGGRGQSSNETMDSLTGGGEETESSSVSVIHLDADRPLLLLRGVPSPSITSTTTSAAQYFQCLDNLTISLSKLNRTWRNVRKIHVYLVSSSSSEFRDILAEYPYCRDSTMVSIVFVHRLEMEYALIQVELWVVR